MKRYIILIAAAVALNSVAMAQNYVGAKIDVEGFEYHADSVKIDINFNLEDLRIGANQSVVFAPKILKGDRIMDLPTLVVQERGSARSYQRAMILESKRSVEAYNRWYGSPLQIIDYYGAGRHDNASYSVTLPYESWMVDSKLFVNCTTCGCCSSKNSGVEVPQNNALMIDIPVVDTYNFMPEVELVKPAKVAVKRRDIAYSSKLIFKVNSTYIDPTLDHNPEELASIDKMMQSVISDSDYTITRVNIIGYASPEGLLSSNMKLSQGRAKALENLMKRKYKTINPKLYNVEFGGENWGKLRELVSEGDLDAKDEVLYLIDSVSIEDGRETKLMQINGGATYKYLLRNVFPATRLVVVDVEYNVDAYDLVRIGELIDSKPQNLSLEEMYRLSETYSVEDDEFEKIFMTAALIYPQDEVAQNNALVTEIRRDNITAAAELVQKIDHDTRSAELANTLGVYYMLYGDYAKAQDMLQNAAALGSQRAANNIVQLKEKLDNIRQIEASEAFRARIYGE